MPRTLTSKIILSKNIKMDRNYKNVLDYSQNDVVNLCRSQAHLVGEKTGYSFIRQQNVIQTDFTFSQCLQANYIAFQNPDYSNEWFFAFIDDVIYKSDNCTEIKYTLDIFTTYFDKWQVKPCFVAREHVNDDTVGLHTLPEDVELGDYIINNVDYYTGLDDLVYIIQSTEPATDGAQKTLALNYGGVFMAGGAYICTNITDFVSILQLFAQKEGRKRNGCCL